jgi:drug/metabolite transporter (DMT)-like permease
MNNRPAKILLYLAFIVNILVFGSSWMFNKMVLQEGVPPIWGAAMRQSIAALVFLIVFLIKRPKLNLSKKHIILIVIYGVFMMALGHIFSFYGQQHIESGLASIIFSFFPLAVILISAILIPKKEPLTLRKIAGTVLGFAGIVLLFYTQNMLGSGTTQILGIVFVLISVFVNSIPNVIIKRDGAELDPLILNTGGFLIASILLLSTAFIVEGAPNFALTKQLIFAELYLGIICSAVGFFLYFWLMRYISVFKLALTAYMTPLVAVFLGYVFYNEILSLNHYIGMLLIFTGIFITEIKYRRKHANKDIRLKGR